MGADYKTFGDFYPFYLAEHSNRTCRRLHFLGTLSALLLLIYVIATASWMWIWLALIAGYGFAWIGHFVFEKNRPAIFQYPFYSLAGDFVMFKDILTGKIRF